MLFIMLNLCICSQSFCYHDVPILCNATPTVGAAYLVEKCSSYTIYIHNNFIHLFSFAAFSYHIEILSSSMLRRVSLLTALRNVELCCLLRQPFMTSYPRNVYRQFYIICAVITAAKVCGLSEGVSNCHFRSKLLYVLCMCTCNLLQWICVLKLKRQTRNLHL